MRDAKPEFLSRPFEVGELLAFVPYRAVRVGVGVETADDYAQDVMRWAGALHTAGMVAEHAQLTGWPEA